MKKITLTLCTVLTFVLIYVYRTQIITLLKPHKVESVAGELNISQSVTGSITLSAGGDVTAGRFIDSGNNAFYIDPAAGGTSGNVAGTITAPTFSGALSGNATSASSAPWTGVTGRPGWLSGGSYVESHANANDIVNSGFYENGGCGTNWPSCTWYNSITVRHSNQGNGHGFMLAMSYYDNNLWFRSFQGGIPPTYQSWAYAITNQNIGSQSVNYATSAGSADAWDGEHVDGTYINVAADKLYNHDGGGWYGRLNGPRIYREYPGVNTWYNDVQVAYADTAGSATNATTATNLSGGSVNATSIVSSGSIVTNGAPIQANYGTGFKIYENRMLDYQNSTPEILHVNAYGDVSVVLFNTNCGGSCWVENTGTMYLGGHVATRPSYRIQLADDSAAKPNGGSWANSSDERLKKNITPIVHALDEINKLQGVHFEWINPDEHGKMYGTQGGFIAQTVKKAFPSWIQEVNPAGKDISLVSTGEKIQSLTLPFEFDALVVESIKELNSKLKTALGDQKNKIETLEDQIILQNTKIAQLEELIKNLQQ